MKFDYRTYWLLAPALAMNACRQPNADIPIAKAGPSDALDGRLVVSRNLLPNTCPSLVATGDLDVDGDLDVVVSVYPHLVILWNQGGGALEEARAPRFVGSVVGLALVNRASGGGPDIAVSIETGTQTCGVLVLRNLASGQFDDPVLICGAVAPYPPSFYPPPVESADLDGDGEDEIIIGGRSLESILIYRAQGDGAYAQTQIQTPGYFQSRVLAGDMDGDGAADLVWTARASEMGGTFVQLNDGHGNFGAPMQYSSEGGGFGALADMDGDGKLDVVLTQLTRGVVVLYNRGDALAEDAVLLESSAHNPMVGPPSDLNGDSLLDIASLDRGELKGGSLSFFANLGGRSFAEPVTSYAGSLPTSLAIGDMDQDGLADLVLGTCGLVSGPGAGVYLLLNRDR